MLDDFITERKIEDQHDKSYKEPDYPDLDGDNVQLNIDQQSYGEQTITNNNEDETKN